MQIRTVCDVASCAFLGYYAAYSGNSLPTIRDNLSVPSSRVKNRSQNPWPLNMGPISCPETSVRNCHYTRTLRNITEQRICYLHTAGVLWLFLLLSTCCLSDLSTDLLPSVYTLILVECIWCSVVRHFMRFTLCPFFPRALWLCTRRNILL